MRLSRSLSLALLSASLVSSTQLLDQPSDQTDSLFPWPHRPRTTTIIDLLSTNAEFAPLIRALQRTQLIPLLNSSENVTLIAPIADAFKDFEGDLTRELLLYHCLNGSVLSNMVENEIVMESLLMMDEKGNSSTGVGVRIERQGDRGRGQGKLMMGGVARVVKSDWEANNGVVQVVDKLMGIPSSIGTQVNRMRLIIESILRDIKDLSTFNELFKETSLPRSYSVFAPSNSAFNTLHPAEQSYLRTHFATQDRTNLIHRHVSKNITYLKTLSKGGSIPSLEGEQLHYDQHDNDTFVDGANITQTDIVARNGVIHVISKLLVPESVVFTPLKYLYGLGNIIFAETLAASDSSSWANDSRIEQTILAPVDAAYAESVDMEDVEVLKRVQYDFLDESVDLSKIKDGTLVKSKYKLKSLGGLAQRIKVKQQNGKFYLNNQVEIISDPVHAGNTTIYSIKDKLTPPGPLRPTSSQGLDLFRSFHHLVSLDLEQRILFDEVGITVLLPVDQAWRDLGLTEKWLLSTEARDSLKTILLGCVVQGVHYFDDFTKEGTTYKTIDGGEIKLHLDGKGHLNFDDLNITAKIDEKDILASNGVGHSLSTVPIPSSINISPSNLINATGQSQWLSLLHDKFPEYLLPNSSHTLLIPLDSSLPSLPLPLNNLLDYHIVPPTSAGPVDLLTSSEITTLSGQTIKIHKIYDNTYTINVNNTSGPFARILDQGKTSSGAQVLLIDSVLLGPPVGNGGWGKSVARVLAVGLTGLAICVGVAGGVGWGVRVWQQRREGKITNGTTGRTEEENRLLDGEA